MAAQILSAILSHPLLLLVGVIIVKLLATRYLSPLCSIPGPFFASFTRLWKVKKWYDGDLHLALIELHRKYGEVIRIGPNEVSIAEPDGIRKIYAAGQRYRKSDYYAPNQGNRTWDMLTERDPHIHANMKKIIGSAYSLTSLMELEPYVDNMSATFSRAMNKFDERNEPINLNYYLQLYAFDVIGEITFSKNFGFVERGKDDNSFAMIDAARNSSSWIGFFPEPFWICWYLFGPNNGIFAISNRNNGIAEFTRKQVNERIAKPSDRRDFISRFLKIQAEKGEAAFSNSDLVFSANSNVFAGSDTTAITLRTVFYYLLKNPSTMAKLVQEIDNADTSGKLSKYVTFKEGQSLPYLQAVIKEVI